MNLRRLRWGIILYVLFDLYIGGHNGGLFPLADVMAAQSLLPSGGIGVSCNAVTAATSALPGSVGGCTSFALITSGGTLPNTFTWQVITTGSPTGLSVNLSGSLDGVTWTTLASMTTATIAAVGPIGAYRFVGCVPVTLSGGSSPTVTCQITASTGGLSNGPSNNSATNFGYGYDVRAFGALLNGTGTTGVGNDDAPAIAACLVAFHQCIIPEISNTETHVRWATPQQIQTVTPNGAMKLICVGSNANGLGPNTSMVSIDVDMGGQTAGPAIWNGPFNGVGGNGVFNGLAIEGCRFRDISTSNNSPGALGMMNVSNNVIFNTGGDSFLAAPVAAPTVAAAFLTCSTSGGTISSAGSVFAKMEALGPGWAPGPASTEVSATAVALGCTSGSACSCTPNAPSAIASNATGVLLFLGTTTGNEFQAGMPFPCSAGTCTMNQNFNFGATNTAATAYTSFPTTGAQADTFDHSGGYFAYLVGTKGWNCGAGLGRGDACGTGSAFTNQPVFWRPDCRNDWSCINIDQYVAETMIQIPHVDAGPNGTNGIIAEGNFQSIGGHFECNTTSNPNSPTFIRATGGIGPRVIGAHAECPAAGGTFITGTSLKKSQIIGNLGDNGLTTYFTDDATSSNNLIMGTAFVGAITAQASDTVINPQTNSWALGGTLSSPANTLKLTADSAGITATTAATAVTQFSFSNLRANTNYSLHCAGTTTQATAGAGIGIAIQGATNAPTNLSAQAVVATAAATTAAGASGNITTTTYTAVYTGATGTLTTQLPWTLDGTIEVGATVPTLNVGFFSINASDAVTVKRDSYCSLLP